MIGATGHGGAAMRIRHRGGPSRIEDRRGESAGGGLGGLGGGRFPIPLPTGKAGGGLGGLGLIGLIIGLLFATGVLGGGGGGFGLPQIDAFPPAAPAPPGAKTPDVGSGDAQAQALDDLVKDIEATWTGLFEGAGKQFEPTVLVLFSGGTNTGCGQASSATGPFYCPLDSRMYIDLDFFRELSSRFGAPGDFAQAYVIAHEYGHHVQNVLGTNDAVSREQQADPGAANELSIRLELQADCYAGVWGHSALTAGALDAGEVEEALGAAAAVGDDRIQAQATGTTNPETWTHGSSAQRVAWFTHGYDTGDPNACDTFGAGDLDNP
jgi:predicted metalloprotease